MARLRVTPEFRSRLSEKLMDLGNVIAAGLVIGQFISGKDFSIALMLLGFILTIGCYIVSFAISQ